MNLLEQLLFVLVASTIPSYAFAWDKNGSSDACTVKEDSCPLLPGGSWVNSVEGGIQVVGGGGDGTQKQPLLLRAKLKTVTPVPREQWHWLLGYRYWQWAETKFQGGDKFANINGKFMAETEYSRKSDSFELPGRGNLNVFQVLGLSISPFSLMLGSHLNERLQATKMELLETKLELRDTKREMKQLQKKLQEAQKKLKKLKK